MLHQLCAVAESQHRDTQLEELFCTGGSTFLVAAVGAAGQDNALGMHIFDFLDVSFIRINFAVYITFTDTTGH